jgi:hypothetical protein
MSVRCIQAPLLTACLAASLWGGATSNEPAGLSPRLAVPRVEPVHITSLIEPQRMMLESRGTLN